MSSSQAVSLSLTERDVKGKKVRQLREQGLVPVVVYEKGKESVLATALQLEITRAYGKAGKHHAVELLLGTKSKKLAFIKDFDRDPVKGNITHVAFHAIKQNQKVEAEIPIHMVGNAPALAIGLLVRLNIDHIVLKGLPADMPDAVDVDVSGVATHEDDVRASALVIPSNVEAIDFDPEKVIVSVTVPRAEVEKIAEEEAAEDAASAVPSDNGGDAATEDTKN